MRISARNLPALGVAHFTAIDVPPLEFVRIAADTGFRRVGLRLHPAFPGAPFYRIPVGSDLMREMRSTLAETGLKVYDIEFVVINDAFDPASLEPVLASSAELGAQRLSVCADDTKRARLITNFASLCDLAGRYGIAVDVEVMPWRTVGTLLAAREVVEAAESPNAGLLIDALHLSRSGGSPSDVSSLPEGFVKSAQLCDASAKRPAIPDALIAEARAGRVFPGKGALPLVALIQALPEDTVLSVEVPINTRRSAAEHLSETFATTHQVLLNASTS